MLKMPVKMIKSFPAYLCALTKNFSALNVFSFKWIINLTATQEQMAVCWTLEEPTENTAQITTCYSCFFEKIALSAWDSLPASPFETQSPEETQSARNSAK